MTPNAIKAGTRLKGFSFTQARKTKKPEQHKAALVWKMYQKLSASQLDST